MEFIKHNNYTEFIKRNNCTEFIKRNNCTEFIKYNNKIYKTSLLVIGIMLTQFNIRIKNLIKHWLILQYTVNS